VRGRPGNIFQLFTDDGEQYSITVTRRAYREEFLRPPSRPVCTGPRQEDGYASFPYPTTKSWSLYKDDIKVVKHGLTSENGKEGIAVYHALNTEGQNSHIAARVILNGLQAQGGFEVPFRRHPPTSTSTMSGSSISIQANRC
jgi:hypothetical protein